jgi:hypothetical protein
MCFFESLQDASKIDKRSWKLGNQAYTRGNCDVTSTINAEKGAKNTKSISKIFLEHVGREISLDEGAIYSVYSAIGHQEGEGSVVPDCRCGVTFVTSKKGLRSSVQNWGVTWAGADDRKRYKDEGINKAKNATYQVPLLGMSHFEVDFGCGVRIVCNMFTHQLL